MIADRICGWPGSLGGVDGINVVANGIVDIGTRLNQVLTEAVRAVLGERELLTDPRRYPAAGRDAVRDEVARLLTVLAK